MKVDKYNVLIMILIFIDLSKIFNLNKSNKYLLYLCSCLDIGIGYVVVYNKMGNCMTNTQEELLLVDGVCIMNHRLRFYVSFIQNNDVTLFFFIRNDHVAIFAFQ